MLTVVASLIFIVLAFVAYSSYVKPAYEAVNQLRGTLVAKTELFESQDKIMTEAKDLLQKYQGASRLQDTVNLALPPSANSHLIFHQLLNLASISSPQLSVTGISVSEGTPLRAATTRDRKKKSILPLIGTVEASVQAAGPYEDFKKMLQYIETNARVMDVVQLSISPEREKLRPAAPGAPPQQAGIVTYKYTISVQSYYQASQ